MTNIILPIFSSHLLSYIIFLFSIILISNYFILYFEFFLNPQISSAQIKIIEVKPSEKRLLSVEQNNSAKETTTKLNQMVYNVNPIVNPLYQNLFQLNTTTAVLIHQNSLITYETTANTKQIQQILYYNYNIPETSLPEFIQRNIIELSSVSYHTSLSSSPPFTEYTMADKLIKEKPYLGIKQHQNYNNFLVEKKLSLAKPERNGPNIQNTTNNF